MTRALHKRGVRVVGVYSTAHQWERITGGASLDRAPVWYAGVGSAAIGAQPLQAGVVLHRRPGPHDAVPRPQRLDGDFRC